MNGFFDEKPVRTCLLLFALTFLFYLKSVGFEFLPSWDDGEYVLENTRVHGLTFENLKVIFTEAYFSNYTPLHLLSYALDFSIWGLNPAGYHLTNITFHALNSAMVYLLARRLTKDGFASAVAALVFAVHPLNVENAAWVSERKTLIAAFFAFASMLSYLSFSKDGAKRRYWLSLFLFALSLLSKPLAVVLPLALSLHELLLRKEPKALKRTLPFFALAALFSLMAFRAQSQASSIEGSTLSPDVLFGVVYPTMLPVYWEYARLIFWPSGLSGFYDATLRYSFLDPAVLASLAAWLAVFALVLWKGSAQVRFWFLWFWAWLLPVANIIPLPVYYADRYMYLPAIGFFMLFGLFVAWLCKRAGSRVGAPIAVAVIVALGAAAFQRMDVWKNEVVFWEDTVRKSPWQDKAHLNLGYAYEMEGRFDEAEKEYMAALAIYRSQEAMSNLEMVRLKKSMSGR